MSVTRSSVPWSIAGLGAGMAALGLLVAAPWVARPVVRVIAWPFVMLVGVIGRLARQNALRVPRRTAATASALMIGLALVAGISVLAQSVKASVSEGVANELRSDFVLNAAEFPIPAAVAVEARGLPDVESVSATSHVPVRIEDFKAVAVAASASDVSANFTVDMSSRDPRRPRRRQRPDRPNHSRPPRLEGGRQPRLPRSAPWPSTSSWSAASTRTVRPSPT